MVAQSGFLRFYYKKVTIIVIFFYYFMRALYVGLVSVVCTCFIRGQLLVLVLAVPLKHLLCASVFLLF